jgi:hypothetical protein
MPSRLVPLVIVASQIKQLVLHFTNQVTKPTELLQELETATNSCFANAKLSSATGNSCFNDQATTANSRQLNASWASPIKQLLLVTNQATS